jgi:CheY-like chemotaxis protein
VSPEGRKLARAKILVVDDEPEVLRFVAGVLERAEYEVAPAPGAKQALEILATGGPFDLVVSDVVMPEMCGPELAREIQMRWPSSSIMFISGCVPVGQLPRGFPYLGKPFSPRDLLGAVDRALAARD